MMSDLPVPVSEEDIQDIFSFADKDGSDPALKICLIQESRLLTMEVSNNEIAQRKLPPGSLQSISWTVFFLIVQ